MTGEHRDPSPRAAAAKNRGWLFGVIVLAATVAGGATVAYHYAPGWIVVACTEAAPLDIGDPALSPTELGALNGRIASFIHSIRNKTPVEPLVLTGEELTALAAHIPELRRLGGRARFSIGEGEIRGEISVPLARVGYPDRWFNGSAAFAPVLEKGMLVVTLRSASVKGVPVPGWIVWTLRNRNLAKELYENPLIAGLIARLDSIEVGKGRITVVPHLRR
jgi:hypothetical protein